jgi:segregation and condensation protein A
VSKSKPELKLVEDTGSQLQAEEFIPELPPQQSEMPFAVVEGEPMTELPRDLYIPPDALQVFLEAFEGPLDLLLYLIRKQNLDILDIPIAEITRQYMKYIDVMAELQLELAGEYLLMAAMLAEIKSRMLLPRPASAEGHDEDDPRAELVRRLQEYERFKKAAEDIDKLARQERDTMPASAELQEHKVVTLLPDVTLKEMLLAFKDVLSRAEKFAHHHITRERLSQRERMSEILDRLQTTAFFEFSQLFKPEEGRMGVTVTFIAILELMKEGLIEIVQAEAYAPIHVRTAQRHLKVVPPGPVASVEADAENQAALAQPELDGENDVEDEPETSAAATQPEDAAVEGALAEAEAVAVALGVDQVTAGDAAAEQVVTTLHVEELAAEAAEPVVAADAEQEVAEVSVTEVLEAEPVVVAFDAADESLPPEAGETPDASAGHENLDEQAAADSEVDEETFAASESDEQPVAPSDTQALATSELDEQATVESQLSEETFDASDSDELPAQASDPQALAISEVSEQAAVDSQVDEERVGPTESDEQPAAPSDTQELAVSESDELVSVDSELDEETFASSEPDEQVVVSSELDRETFEATQAAEQPAFDADEASVGDIDPAVADEPFAVQETSGDLQASVVVEGDAGETVVEEHVVEEHLVPEHVVEENVVPEHVVEDSTAQLDQAELAVDTDADLAQQPSDITDEPVASADMDDAVEDQPERESSESNQQSSEQPSELSVSDDSVTESSSEADNSDAEPSR